MTKKSEGTFFAGFVCVRELRTFGTCVYLCVSVYIVGFVKSVCVCVCVCVCVRVRVCACMCV